MDALISLLKNMEFEKMIPSLGSYLFFLKLWCFVLVMAGPAAILALGILYQKKTPEGADCFWAYRSKAAMKDRQVWNEAHRVAGKHWRKLGAALCIAGAAVGVLVFILPGNLSAMLTLIAVCVELVLIAASRVKIDRQLKNI